MKVKSWLARFSLVFQVFRKWVREALLGRHQFLRYPPGHFYSPLPDSDWRKDAIDSSLKLSPGFDGVDLRIEQQVTLLRSLADYRSEYPFKEQAEKPFRYGYGNEYFPRTDGSMLYGVLRHFRPKRLVEVGSGHSSALMLDVNERFFEGGIGLTFIEPYPKRLLELIAEDEREEIDLLACKVQEVPLSVFERLQANDILFIDSSHVSKFGSDANHLIFNILPRLNKGVLVHIHDVPYPFEYPDNWFDEGRAWNEAYLTRAFLQYNSGFAIRLWSSCIGKIRPEVVQETWPELTPGTGFSIWLEKLV